MEFLNEENVCGRNLLNLVSRGSAILAELQRLADFIPKIFYTTSVDYKKYSLIIFDFTYLNNIDSYEDKIQQNMDLVDLDESFREAYMPLLERFYLLFESIYKYYAELMKLMDDINDLYYINYNLETILQDPDGKRLVVEGYHLFGCMLLMLDDHIPGPIREKLIISYYRYKGGQASISNINEVCKLCKQTGYLPPRFNAGTTKRPEGYPEFFFSRFKIDSFLSLMKLKSWTRL